MSFASDKQAEVGAQFQTVAAQIDSLKTNADAQIKAITDQLTADTTPLVAQYAVLDAQLQVLNQVVAQELQATTPYAVTEPEQATDPNTGQPVQ